MRGAERKGKRRELVIFVIRFDSGWKVEQFSSNFDNVIEACVVAKLHIHQMVAPNSGFLSELPVMV